MEFCDDCGSMMMADGSAWECTNCGSVRCKEDTDAYVLTEKQRGAEAIVIDDESKSAGLAKTDETCPECSNEKAYWYLQQTRAADESETRFFICTECDHQWRGYD